MTHDYNFERGVAAIFRTLGASVEHDVNLAGNQIDVLLTEKTPAGITVRTAVECKAFSKRVGIETLNFFAQLASLLKQRGLVDKAALVAQSGFTNRARQAGKAHHIDLIEIADLQQAIAGQETSVRRQEDRLQKEEQRAFKASDRQKRIFVVMPFSKEFDDVFLLGVRAVGEELNLVVERADTLEHTEEIVDVIRQRIVKADVVIADTSKQNPNVHYEVGLAHASHIPTILIAREGEKIPFDLRNVNHIFCDQRV